MRALLAEPKRVSFGVAGILVLTLVYTIGISLTLVRHPWTKPLAAPILRIAPERYYVYELFFLLPVAVVSVVVHAGVSHLVCWVRGGRGTFDDLFALLGFSYVILALVMGIPDLLLGLFRPATSIGPHVVLGTFWFSILSVFAVKEAEKVSWVMATVASLSGLLANAALQFTFMR